jgi:hypothetical protein
MPTIEEDLRSWSREVLEVPNRHLKGLPACPYARQAWRENKVLVLETENVFAAAMSACFSFSQSDKDLVVVASYGIPDIHHMHGFVQELNRCFPTLHCMEFHPDYGAEDAELDFLTDNAWESAIDEPYCMIFVQELDKVVTASDKLQVLGYYDTYPPDEYDSLVVQRKRRLETWQ